MCPRRPDSGIHAPDEARTDGRELHEPTLPMWSFSQGLDAAVGMARSLPLEVNLAKIQNICYELLQTAYNGFQEKGEEGGQNASAWIEHFRALAEKLSVRVAEEPRSSEPDLTGAKGQQVQG